MTDNQNAKLNMAQRVLDTLNRYQAVYSSLPPVEDAVKALEKDITNIRDVQTNRILLNLPASTLKKREAEANMIETAVRVANILYIIGFKTNNKDLIKMYGLSEHTFYHLSGNKALALARQVLELANKSKTELASYGIDAAAMTLFEKAIENYNTLIAKPMDTITEKKQMTTNLAQLFAGLDSTLYDNLDKAMILFKKSHPEFYGEYRTSRNIIFQNEGKSAAVKNPRNPKEIIQVPPKGIVGSVEEDTKFAIVSDDSARPKGDIIDIPTKP